MEPSIFRTVSQTSLLKLTTQALPQQLYILELLIPYCHFEGFQSSTRSNLCLAAAPVTLKLLMEWLFDPSRMMPVDAPCRHGSTLCSSVVDVETSCMEVMVSLDNSTVVTCTDIATQVTGLHKFMWSSDYLKKSSPPCFRHPTPPFHRISPMWNGSLRSRLHQTAIIWCIKCPGHFIWVTGVQRSFQLKAFFPVFTYFPASGQLCLVIGTVSQY